jgi:hypothetical protein
MLGHGSCHHLVANGGSDKKLEATPEKDKKGAHTGPATTPSERSGDAACRVGHHR